MHMAHPFPVGGAPVTTVESAPMVVSRTVSAQVTTMDQTAQSLEVKGLHVCMDNMHNMHV